MTDSQTTCACIGGSTYGTSDPAIRLCDLCGDAVPTGPGTGEHVSSRTPAQTTPAIAAALGFTKAELRGCERLRDRIKFDLYVAPRDNDTARAWCARQEVALEVIEERIKHGR